jgi:MinD superfamily P-loop ATPase
MTKERNMQKIVVKPGDEPPAPEVMAQAIVDIAAGMKRLTASRLRRDTIILLLHDATRIGKRDIGYVLNALDRLEELYLKPKPPTK